MSSLDTLRERGIGGFAHEHPIQFGLAIGLLLGGFALLNGGSAIGAFVTFFLVGNLVAIVYSYTIDFLSTTRGHPASQTPVSDANPDPERALHELRERYARGHLSEAEFEDRVERLLETETVESAREHVSEATEPERERT